MKLKTISKLGFINLKIHFFPRKVRPYKLLLQLTNDCNSRCRFCHIWKINSEHPEKKKLELTSAGYEKFLIDYGQNVYWISLSGGEVSLYSEIEALLLIIKQTCPKLLVITFTTNGLLPDKILSISLAIKKLFIDTYFFVTISMDGDRDLHNQLRGISNNYELATQTKKLLLQQGIRSHWGATLNNSNASYFAQAKHSEIKAISISHDGGIYNVEFKNNNILILEALKNIIRNYKVTTLAELFELSFLKIGRDFLINNRNKLPIPCASLQTSLHIAPNGDISPCMFLPPLGNIRYDNISNILQSSSVQSILKKIKNEECPKCWMNCYGPHSMIRYPIKTLKKLLWI